MWDLSPVQGWTTGNVHLGTQVKFKSRLLGGEYSSQTFCAGILDLGTQVKTEDGSIYEFTSKLPLHSVATQDKINPHKKLSLGPFPPSSLCHIFLHCHSIIIPWSIHITKAPNLSWSSFPLLFPFPPSHFLHCCCRQLLYHQFSCNSCGLCQDMEHRLGAALRSGSSVLTAVVSDNTVLHTAIHTAIQVAEGHQLTAGARKLANFSSLLYLVPYIHC